MAEQLDVLVVGAGLVGLAIARSLARAGREVVVAEASAKPGQGLSSRSSEVLHSGIYYPTGTLKHRLCMQGLKQTKAFANKHRIACLPVGKLIVATDAAKLEQLRALQEQAVKNGLGTLPWLDAEQVTSLEPQVQARAALHVKQTAVINSHELTLALEAELLTAGGTVVPGNIIESLHRAPRVEIDGTDVVCRNIVVAAGLASGDLLLTLPHAKAVPSVYFAKGQYLEWQGDVPFSRLIYPLPESGGLGVHATIGTDGQLRFGPDVAWVQTPDFAFDDSRVPSMLRAIRRYFPELEESRLRPGTVGVRPKLHGADGQFADFWIEGPDKLGSGVWGMLGIESPGLTAALAIGDYVAGRMASSKQ